MKLDRHILLATAFVLCASSALTQVFHQPGTDQKTTITVNADGSCLIRREMTLGRAVTQQYVSITEQIEKAHDQSEAETDDGAEPSEATQAEPKTLSDSELADKYRKQMESTWERNDSSRVPKMERVEVQKDELRLVWTNAFSSIKSMVDDGRVLLMQAGFSFQKIRFETDTNAHLRMTIVNSGGARRSSRNTVEAWKQTRHKGEQRFVFPGKVLSSGYPSAEGNATWIATDWEKEETLKAAMKLNSTAEIVVVTELGGLKLDQPVESSTEGYNPFRRSEVGGDKPVVDAGPGFVAEAEAVTLTTIHRFPGAPKEASARSSYRGSNPGLTVCV
jgi:hypothetical protein